MGKPKPPAPPDPVAVSQAQSQSNIATAREQQRMNMIGTAGPQGTVRYEADANSPGGYRQVTELSPAEQSIYDAQKQTELGATNIAHGQLGRVQGALETPLSTAGLPDLSGGPQAHQLQHGFDQGGALATHVQPGQIQTGFNPGQPLQYGFNPGQGVQGDVGGDLNMQRLLASQAVYGQAASRLDPRFATDEDRLRTKLSNQGFSQNSEGYRSALDDFGRNKNDAYNQAIFSSVGAGEDAANSLFQRQLGQGQFHNTAAGQEYTQNAGQAQFHNQTAGQEYGQNLGAAQFGNQAQQQQFGQGVTNAELNNAAQGQLYGQNLGAAQFGNQVEQQGFGQEQAAAQFGNQARQQGLNERAYLQNQPINQLTGLLSLGQVGMPQGVQYTPSQVATTDVIGANALSTQAQQAAYNARAQQQSGMMNGLFSLGSAAIMGSDRKLKDNIVPLRRRRDGLTEYEFSYRGSAHRFIGVMADEVKKVRPDLVVKRADGYLAVSYAGLEAA